MKHEYHIEYFANGKWSCLLQAPVQYCRGYIDARRDYSPRLAHRIKRSDGRVMEEISAREDVNIGMIAGWPSAEQYEAAANRAFECAKVIRESQGR